MTDKYLVITLCEEQSHVMTPGTVDNACVYTLKHRVRKDGLDFAGKNPYPNIIDSGRDTAELLPHGYIDAKTAALAADIIYAFMVDNRTPHFEIDLQKRDESLMPVYEYTVEDLQRILKKKIKIVESK